MINSFYTRKAETHFGFTVKASASSLHRTIPDFDKTTSPGSSVLFSALDGKSGGKLQPGDEVSIDRLSRRSVVFTNRPGFVCHKEGVAQQREYGRKASARDEVGID